MRDRILKLREEGKSYRAIASLVGCAKSTAVYHCNEDQKEKSRNRGNKNRVSNPILKKLDNFKNRPKYTKVRDFQKKGSNTFTFKDVINKVGDNPKCYITGRIINLDDTPSYHFDHIIPSSKGGEVSLDNLGIACRDANRAKSDMYLQDFLLLCKDTLENNGYIVNKIEE